MAGRRALYPELALSALLILPPGAFGNPSNKCLWAVLVGWLAVLYAGAILHVYLEVDVQNTSASGIFSMDGIRAVLLTGSEAIYTFVIHAISVAVRAEVASAGEKCLEEPGVLRWSYGARRRLLAESWFHVILPVAYLSFFGALYVHESGLFTTASPGLAAFATQNLFFALHHMLLILSVLLHFVSFLAALQHNFLLLNETLARVDRGGSWPVADRPVLADVVDIRVLHLRLVADCTALERAYSRQMLFALAYVFFKFLDKARTLLSTYWATSTFTAAQFAFQSLYYFFMLSYPAIQAQLVTNEATRTASVAVQLINESPNLHDNVVTELLEFLEQLSHTKVRFTAWNLWTIECSMVYGVVVFSSTYLVLMIQYQ